MYREAAVCPALHSASHIHCLIILTMTLSLLDMWRIDPSLQANGLIELWYESTPTDSRPVQ